MFEIRPAALSEFSLLPELEAEADVAFGRLDPPVPYADFPAPATAEQNAGALHIMVAGRPPCGFVRLVDIDGRAHLEQLAVSLDYGHQGIGRALVQAAKAWARESGFHEMSLCTFADVPFNGPFYASCGFVEIPQAQLTPGLQLVRQEEVAMGLDAVGRRITMIVVL